MVALCLSGCALGERPSFDETAIITADGTMTGDPAIDAVLARLDDVGAAQFTATYRAVVTFGGITTDVTVVQAGGGARRSTTIGEVTFRTIDGTVSTCVQGVCTSGSDAVRVSDTGVTPELAFGAMAKRLRRDAVARIGDTVASTMEVSGETATCVDVPVSGGTKVYCALANGVLARFVGGDVTVELTSYEPVVDPAAFDVP